MSEDDDPLGDLPAVQRMSPFDSAMDLARRGIRATDLMELLQAHAFGLNEMSTTQMKAAEIVLRKAVPDLKAVEHSGIITTRVVREMTDAELASIAAGGSARTADPAKRPN